MEKIIEVDISCNENLYEKYNKKVVSKELINYLINSTPKLTKNDKLKIIINNETQEKDLIKVIRTGLTKEFEISMQTHDRDNVIQFVYLLVGVFGLFLSTLINDTILKEVILIGGWVFIWALVEMEIFNDFRGRKKRFIIKKLLDSEMIEK